MPTATTTGGSAVWDLPTTSRFSDNFCAALSDGLGLGDTESCQSNSSWLGKSCRVLSWILRMCHAGPTCTSTCVKTECSALDCGFHRGLHILYNICLACVANISSIGGLYLTTMHTRFMLSVCWRVHL